ncbi:TetR/AcrR family transcriptional regulator [Aquiflexum lacus]|uniref:TetR/AcrR family transcriptional regulator n=1 Tax=Aquiflexum lacus TaxID=2483805 RepID=UPI001892F636|nr:TetR/AcrR family transcriptional regulator [Aquiflexum lacus]
MISLEVRYRLVSLFMRNPELTKEKIISISAGLFNTQGYKATSISDITKATGLTKGAIYRHFTDKEDLEESTFHFMAEKMKGKFREVIKKEMTAPEKLLAIAVFFRTYVFTPVIQGGCPILNAGVETDDTRPELNKSVRDLLNTLQSSVEHILQKGISYGQIKEDIEVERFASVFIATLEGGVLLSKIRQSPKDLFWVIEDLEQRIKSISA